MRVIARIDPHAMNAEAFAAHPEWASIGPDGKARRHPTAPDLYLTCNFGGYHFDLMPKVIDEIAARYPVDGFFGNRWNGSGVCYCASCKAQYRAATGGDIPAAIDVASDEGRRYAGWAQDRMFALIDLWNAAIRKRRRGAFFMPGSERRGLINYDGRELGRRLPLVFCDRQARAMDDAPWSPGSHAWNAGRFAKELHAFMDDKPVGHIISVGVEEAYRWKDSVQSEAEIRIWAAGAIAHGSRPWLTKFNAKPLDRRWMPVVSSIYDWHHANERYLRNTANLARVAIVLSSRTASILGGARHRHEIEGHLRGFYQALLESKIPFTLIDDGFLDPQHLSRYRLLILPNAALMSDAQCAAIRAFVAAGGRIVATHETSLYDENGKRRADFGLADLFGCHFDGEVEERVANSYLTLRQPHAALAGMEDVPRTIGAVKRIHVRPDGDSEVPLTLVPSYSDLPMERVYTDKPTSDIPMALCRTVGAGRVAYLPMDLDRTFDELAHADHLHLLQGFVAWAADERQPLVVTGRGMVDISFWQQAGSVAAHLVNLNNPMAMSGSYREAIPSGAYTVELALPRGASVKSVRLLEAGRQIEGRLAGGRLTVEVPSILVHEVVAVDLA